MSINCPSCGVAIEQQRFRCRRCRHSFKAYGPPARCPRCDSRYWNVLRGTLKRGRPPKKKDPA